MALMGQSDGIVDGVPELDDMFRVRALQPAYLALVRLD